jgi:DNA-binding CsgD family transcriptional regulator
VPGRLRVFLIGLEREDLELLRLRSETEDRLEVAGAALLREFQRGVVPLPDATDAIVVSPAAWPRVAAPAAIPARRDAGSDERLIEELTAREREVLALVADGHPNREIATRLGISDHTVKFHLASLFGKLGVSTRTQAVRRALESGLIDI